MRHFVIFAYILSFSTGFTALVLFFIVYLKFKIKIVRSYLIFLLLFTLYIVIAFFSTYSKTIINVKTDLIFVLINSSYFIWLGMFAYYMPYFIHRLLGLGFTGLKKNIFVFITSVIYLMLAVPFIFVNKLPEINSMLNFELNDIAAPLLIPVVFYILYLLWHYKAGMENEVNKKILDSILFLSVIFLPGLLLDFIYPKTRLEWKMIPRGFSFSSVYYLCWNAVSIVFIVQYLVTKINILPDINIPGPFVRKFSISEKEYEIISLIVKGYSNRQIADSLFIANQTVKDNIFNIYRKAGVSSRMGLIGKVNEFIFPAAGLKAT